MALASPGCMRRLVTLITVAVLTTGCISGLDRKPYSIRVGPRIDPDHQALLVVGALLVGVACATGYVLVDNARD